MVAKNFQIRNIKITGKKIFESKSWICLFLLIPLRKTLPSHYHSRQKEITYLPQTKFFENIFPQQRGVEL